jgi:hypothetical protein
MLERGATVRTRATLTPTRQRRAARWVAIGGSALVLAAVGLGAAWGVAEHDGGALEAKRDSVGLTEPELARYLTERERRDQYRAATLVTVCVGGALGISAAALYYFDRPAPP